MAAEPEEPRAVAAHAGFLRASHADREHVIGLLKTAFVQGRVTLDEFEVRLGQALASRTYADLAELVADLPAGPAGTSAGRPPGRPDRTGVRPPESHAANARRYAVIAFVLMMAAVVAPRGPALLLFMPLGCTAVLLAAAQTLASQALASQQHRRSLGQGGSQR